MNSRCRSTSRCSASASRRTSSMPARCRWACQAMATNMAAMSGTSASSSQSCPVRATDQERATPVTTTTTPMTAAVVRWSHTRYP
jgi:hypothetical protein